MMADWGDGWHYTFRTWPEIEQMHPTLEPMPVDADEDREVWGETLDEEIPDDLMAYLI